MVVTGMFDAIDDSKDRHQLEFSYRFFFITNAEGEEGSNADKSADDLFSTGSFATVEQFWGYYSHLVRPNELPENVDCCLFKGGSKPLEDDEANRGGGKWTIRLRKGLASRFWEEMLLAIIGGVYNLDTMISGTSISIRAEEDTLAVWTDHRDRDNTLRIREAMIKILNLPQNTAIDFKRHSTVIPIAQGSNYYSIQQLLQYRDHCAEPPAYVWESLEAVAELKPGREGFNGGREGDNAGGDEVKPLRDTFQTYNNNFSGGGGLGGIVGIGRGRPPGDRRDRDRDQQASAMFSTGDPLLDGPGGSGGMGRRGPSLWD